MDAQKNGSNIGDLSCLIQFDSWKNGFLTESEQGFKRCEMSPHGSPNRVRKASHICGVRLQPNSLAIPSFFRFNPLSIDSPVDSAEPFDKFFSSSPNKDDLLHS